MLSGTAASPASAGRSAAAASAARRAEAERALRSGRYEAALKLAGELARGTPPDAPGTILAARAALGLGRYEEARRRLEAAVDAWPDNLPLRDCLMRLYESTGQRGALTPLIDRSYDDWKNGRVDKTHAVDLMAVATAVRLDNNWKDANDVLRDAVRADPKATEANVDWGFVFLEKHSVANAETSFRDVLKLEPDHPDAHVGLARVLLEQSYDVAAADAELGAALAVNPHHAGALALRAEIALDGEDFAGTAALVAALRKVNPRDPGAARLAAASALLRDDRAGYEQERDGRLAVNATDGDFFAFVAEALDHHRRYDDARGIADEGVRVDPTSARCLLSLGTTLLRLGDEEEGLSALRKAWKRDPYDVRTFNLLNLFDKVIPSQYTSVKTEHLRFRVPIAARVAVQSVVAPFLEETYARYVARYGFTPRGPIVLELYADAAHYGVRTVGLPAIGVAGVCFGRVITSQAPTNHVFNWALVLSHELAHVFAIELSRSRVPRWFTEGLAELETMRARPEWSRHDEVAVWGGLKTGRLPTLINLSTAFTRAQDADDATAAYAHAAAALDFLERRFGFAKIRAALVQYGRGARGADVLETLSGMKADELEAAFRADFFGQTVRYDQQYLPTQTLRRSLPEAQRLVAASPRSAIAHVQLGLAALNHGDEKTAAGALGKASALAGGSAGVIAGSAAGVDEAAAILFLTAELALARRDADRAMAALEALLALPDGRGDGYDVRVRLALSEIHRKNQPRAEAHLRKAIAFDPTRVEAHALLTELLGDMGRPEDKLTEQEATLRLESQSIKVAKQALLANARAGRAGRVIALAATAIFIDPADPEIHAALARALASTGQTAAAARSFEQALLFSPAPTDAADIHRALAGLYTRLGDGTRAAAHNAAVR
ncbi:MAG TPA: tetratricopeptide repeat protein [Polyangia bacterium]|nr:tetratricopeptide repeat protein [Polyangia bacterium]